MASQAIHKQEREQFVKLFKQDRIDRFQDRLAILEVFLRIEHHMTAHELTLLVNQEGHAMSDEFVGDTIELMCRYGFAQRNLFDNEAPRYEHRHLGQHHDHMICTKCKKIIEFENPAIEQLQVQVAADHGFHMLQHKMELTGICRQCLELRDGLITLDRAKIGERLIVKGFSGGVKARLRLLTMGLRPGDQVEVITNMQQGQLVIAVDYKRLVLGRGLAQKISVAPLHRGDAALPKMI
jgi:Fur family transcriptional regulator, ferric uptake regulator